MKDLIQQATAFADSGASFTGAEVRLWVGKLTDALEKLTAGDVELPVPAFGYLISSEEYDNCWVSSRDPKDGEAAFESKQMRAAYASGVAAEREWCAQIVEVRGQNTKNGEWFGNNHAATAFAAAIRKGTP